MHPIVKFFGRGHPMQGPIPAMPLPLANSYWVIPGRLLAGEHPYGAHSGDARQRLGRLQAVGIDVYVDLTEELEMPDYRPLLPRRAEYLRFGIVDATVPNDSSAMRELLSRIRDALARERRVYVHCRAGIGRTGLVIGCHLVEDGLSGKAALKRLNNLWRQSARSETWPTVPQTRLQAEYIREWPRLRQSGADPGAAQRGARGT